MTAFGALCSLFFIQAVTPGSLKGEPKEINPFEKIESWSGNAHNMPNGKMFMMPKVSEDKSSGFIINPTPNNFCNSSTSSIQEITGAYTDMTVRTQNGNSFSNFLLVDPTDVPIPSAEETGL